MDKSKFTIQVIDTHANLSQPQDLQPSGGSNNVTVKEHDSNYDYTVACNRKGQGNIAARFNQLTAGEGHMTTETTQSDKQPEKLNFFFEVQLNTQVKGKTINPVFYIGQGHTGSNNNWWVGNKDIRRKGSEYYYYHEDTPVLSFKWNNIHNIRITNMLDN